MNCHLCNQLITPGEPTKPVGRQGRVILEAHETFAKLQEIDTGIKIVLAGSPKSLLPSSMELFGIKLEEAKRKQKAGEPFEVPPLPEEAKQGARKLAEALGFNKKPKTFKSFAEAVAYIDKNKFPKP